MSVKVSRHASARYAAGGLGPAFKRHPDVTLAREVGLVALAVYGYFFVRGLVHARESEAIANAEWLVSIERGFGIFHEQRAQHRIVGHEWLVSLVNGIYIYGHWPVVVSTLAWLFFKHREMFPVFRTAMIASGLMGFAFFFLFPMAPPRFLLEPGFVDTVTLYSEAYRVFQPPSLTNQFAAMPSLHVGWNLLMGIAIASLASQRVWKLFGVSMPVAMYASTVLTANHFFLDGVVGSVIALAGLAIAWRLSRPRVAVWTSRPMTPIELLQGEAPS